MCHQQLGRTQRRLPREPSPPLAFRGQSLGQELWLWRVGREVTVTSSDSKGEEGRCPSSFFPALKISGKPRDREKRGRGRQPRRGRGGIGSPPVPPARPRPSPRGLLDSCSLWRQRQSGRWCREDRGCSKTTATPALELGAAGRWRAQERGGPMPTQSPEPKAQADPHHPGEGPTSPPRSTHPKPHSRSAQQPPCPATHVGLALSRSHGRRQSPCASLCRARRARSICSRSCFHWA